MVFNKDKISTIVKRNFAKIFKQTEFVLILFVDYNYFCEYFDFQASKKFIIKILIFFYLLVWL